MTALPRLAPLSGGGSGPWLRPLRCWPSMAAAMLRRQGELARVLVTGVRGSTPREPGSCMLVSSGETQGTIGGGRLEWQALAAARGLLADTSAEAARLQRFTLGTQLGQCCGGVVELWLERYTSADLPLLDRLAQSLRRHDSALLLTELHEGHLSRRLPARAELPPDPGTGLRLVHSGASRTTLIERLDPAPPLWLYGAGHVGQALVRLLAELPLAVTWLDDRSELLPAQLPEAVDARAIGLPAASVAAAPAGTRFLVMTHDHGLDYALCRAMLGRRDSHFVGLIGSQSKAARFRSRLAHDGLDAAAIAQLACPVGIAGINCKWPAAIAVAVAAQILQTLPQDSKQPEPAATAACSPEACTSCHQIHGARP